MDVAADTARPDRRPSLQSIDREHHLTPTRAQVRAPRILVVLTLLQVALYVAVGHRWTALCWGLVLVAYVLQARAVRRMRTVLDEDGVRVHNGVTRPRLVPWRDVVEVHVQSRWETASRLVRRSGRDVPLHGVPVEVARQLAAQLGGGAPEPVRSSGSPSPASEEPLVEDLGTEGPFRRGRARS